MKFQLKRLLSQLSILFAANLGALGFKTGFCFPFFYCNACPAATSACPLRAIEVGVFNGEFKWKLITYPLLIIGTIGVLTGRAVCGWACPIGLLQRTTGRVPKKLKRKFPSIAKIGQHKIERYFRYTKYFVLIGLVVITPILIGFMFTDICPVGVLTGTLPIMILNPSKYVPNPFFHVALIVFILFFVLIFIIERGWCRYFCPVGALLAPFNKVSFLHISVNKEECIHCNVCSDECPMGIDIPNMHRNPECILCGKCINACPKNLIKFERI
ncbi:MAG: 4Fe-4S binding protein [Thermoplasmatales archaeon]|nr:4Fe-4S binding protein [Thermoplasmatales archaeon]